MAEVKLLSFEPSILKPPLGPGEKAPGDWQPEAQDF